MSNLLSEVHPELIAEWLKKNALMPTEVSVGSHKKIVWKGKCGHEWIATVKSRAISNTDCPYCSHNKILEGYNDPAHLRNCTARSLLTLKPTAIIACRL